MSAMTWEVQQWFPAQYRGKKIWKMNALKYCLEIR